MRDHITTAIEVIGCGLITAGVWTQSTAAGLITGGLLCIGLGYLGGRK